MSLSPKAIFVLMSLKSNAALGIGSTSTENEAPQSVNITLLDPPKSPKEPKSTVRMRHAKAPGAYQRWRQRGDCW